MISDVKWHKYKKYWNQVKNYKESKYTKYITGAGNKIAWIGDRAGDSFLPRRGFFQFARKHINISWCVDALLNLMRSRNRNLRSFRARIALDGVAKSRKPPFLADQQYIKKQLLSPNHAKMHDCHSSGGAGSAIVRANLYIIITPPTKFFAITPPPIPPQSAAYCHEFSLVYFWKKLRWCW